MAKLQAQAGQGQDRLINIFCCTVLLAANKIREHFVFGKVGFLYRDKGHYRYHHYQQSYRDLTHNPLRCLLDRWVDCEA